jgi:hypothetical protein
MGWNQFEPIAHSLMTEMSRRQIVADALGGVAAPRAGRTVTGPVKKDGGTKDKSKPAKVPICHDDTENELCTVWTGCSSSARRSTSST